MKRLVALALCISFVAPSLALAVGSRRASYTGGTASVFSGAKDPIEGDLNTSEEKALTLAAREVRPSGPRFFLDHLGCSRFSRRSATIT
jgi:hypothetical protein